jgi:hypothetical protein
LLVVMKYMVRVTSATPHLSGWTGVGLPEAP